MVHQATKFPSKTLIKIGKIKNLANLYYEILKYKIVGFPGGAVVESLPAGAGDTGSSPGLGGSHMPRSS